MDVLSTTGAVGESPADGQLRQLDARVIQVDRLGCGITSLVFAGGAMIAALVVTVQSGGRLPVLAAVGIGLVALLIVLAIGVAKWPQLAYRYRWYRLDDLGLEIRAGVLFRRVAYVPRSRIQHMDVNQGPIERHFGLAHVVLHTAGTESSSVTLAGLEQHTATRIRDHLVRTSADDAV